ncbi:hypothetical protein O3P69_019085 [Scylla paramamosain]|uniref:MULE transposase domain-containing protein n=1 Tax=Scylla paramamosain TaxID=85552 RepID=A0AAW0T947_SCYPA
MSEESHREARQVRKIEGQRRGSTVYVFDDQAYVKDRQYNEKLHVRCHLVKSGYHGRGHINLENSTMMVTKDHNHDSQASYIEQMELKSHVYDERCARAPASAATSVSFESVRRTLLNERNKYLPPAPASPLEAADFLASNTMFQSFYKGVATYNDNLALIMYEDGIEDIVMHVEETAMDATFSVVPAIFEEHLTIFGRFGDNFLPMFHVLMTSRQGELYTAVLNRIKSQLPGLDPTIVHSDLKVAIHNAIADKIEEGLQFLRNSKPQIPRQATVDSLVEYYNFWLRRIGVDSRGKQWHRRGSRKLTELLAGGTVEALIKRTRYLGMKKRVLRTDEPDEEGQQQVVQVGNETEAEETDDVQPHPEPEPLLEEEPEAVYHSPIHPPRRSRPREAAAPYTPPRTRMAASRQAQV